MKAKVPVTARPHTFYIRPAPGWLYECYREVSQIIESPFQKYKFEPKAQMLKSTVKVSRCDWRQGLEILLRVTTAHDVEWLVLESKCSQWSEVDAILKRVPWEEMVTNKEAPVHVTVDIYNGFTTGSAKLRENFCKFSGLSHVPEGANLRFRVELRNDFLRILVSLGGEPLYKRGYKAKLIATAPLPEHQAAACIRWILSSSSSAASPEFVFVPFAGSGTFGFESRVVFSGAGSGAFSRTFACELFPVIPPKTLEFLRRKLKEKFQAASPFKILFNELNEQAVQILGENAKGLLSEDQFTIQSGDVFNWKPDFPGTGKILILLNPPYGNRLAKNSSVDALYERLGKYLLNLMKAYPGRIMGGCICPDESTWKRFLSGLNSPKAETHHFSHGGEDMRLVRWEDK
ncbi:MAG: hypothetical protein ACKN9V_00915 [Pseudomonadota bacterium]